MGSEYFTDQEFKDIVEAFATETYEILDNADKMINDLDSGYNEEIIDTIFRIFHSLKGSAGFLKFENIRTITHEAENLLCIFRDKKLSPTHKEINLLYLTTDFIRQILDNVQKGLNSEKEDEMTEIVINNISDCIKNLENEASLKEHDKLQGSTGLKNDDKFFNDTDILSQINNSIPYSERQNNILNIAEKLKINQAVTLKQNKLQYITYENFNASSGYLENLIDEHKENTKIPEMISVGTLFNNISRLITGLANKEDKEVNLHVSGINAEINKNLVDKIYEPILHIIRNAVDHGFEKKKERLNKKKSEANNIFLKAQYKDDELWLSFKEDGKGFNRENILKKAKEKGLLKDNGNNLTNEQVWELVFKPGLSTAKEITSISGRGVGMDIVKKNIEKLSGKVKIISEPDKGTEIILKIPLSLEVINVLVIKQGNNFFSLPLSNIIKIITLDPTQINFDKKNFNTIKYDNEKIQVIDINNFFTNDLGKIITSHGLGIIIHNDIKKWCFYVEKIIAVQKIVIKSLINYSGNIKGIIGYSILNNGNMILILDIDGIENEILKLK